MPGPWACTSAIPLGWALSRLLRAGLEKTYAWIEVQVARKRAATQIEVKPREINR